MTRRQQNVETFLQVVGSITCMALVAGAILLVIVTGTKIWSIDDHVTDLYGRPPAAHNVYIVPPVDGTEHNNFIMPKKENF